MTTQHQGAALSQIATADAVLQKKPIRAVSDEDRTKGTQPLRAGYNSLVPDLGLQRHLLHPKLKSQTSVVPAPPTLPLLRRWFGWLTGQPKAKAVALSTQLPPKI